MYSLDFNTLGKHYLPPFLRKLRNLAWLRSLLSPLGTVNADFVAYVDEKRQEVSYNGQVIVLEKLLNDSYPDAAGGIYIDSDGTYKPVVYTYFKSEGQPWPGFSYFKSEGVGEEYSYFKSEDTGAVDFVVMVPAALTFDSTEMTVLINKYKAAGKRYLIQTY